MKRLFTVTLMAVFLFSAMPVLAQSTFDIKGWNKAEWGMTESELKNIFKDTLIKSEKREARKGFYIDLKISDFVIDGIPFDVFFEMGKDDNTLKGVRLLCDWAYISYFGQFELLLTMKYGSPILNIVEEAKLGEDDQSASWLLPSTQIELQYRDRVLLGAGVLNIWYTDMRYIIRETDKL